MSKLISIGLVRILVPRLIAWPRHYLGNGETCSPVQLTYMGEIFPKVHSPIRNDADNRRLFVLFSTDH